MAAFLAITRREATGLFLNPAILFAIAFFVLLNSFAFHLYLTDSASPTAAFDEIALFIIFTSLLTVPIITMRSFAQETLDGTLEVLLTAPVRPVSVVLGKWAGAWLFYLATLFPGIVYACLLGYAGRLDYRCTIVALATLAVVGAMMCAMGTLISSLTSSTAAAAAATAGVLVLFVMLSEVSPDSGPLAKFLYESSFLPHAKRWISGELDTRGLVYFCSITALALFYTWLAAGWRGRPRRIRNPVARRRMLVTTILMGLGFLSILTQVAMLHIAGLWESGPPWRTDGSGAAWRWFIPLIVGVFTFGWSVLTFRAARRAARNALAGQQKFSTISDGKVTSSGLYFADTYRSRLWSAGLAIVAALVIVINVNWLANYSFRTFSGRGWLSILTVLQPRTWDVTEEKANSLSPETRQILDRLQGRVTAFAFFSSREEYNGIPLADEMRFLLERYRNYNGGLLPVRLDVNRDPDRVMRLAKEFGLPKELATSSLVLEYGGRRLTIPVADLVAHPDWRSRLAGVTRFRFDGERGVTQALARLIDPRKINVSFLAGHYELSPFTGFREDRTAVRFSRALERLDMRVHQVFARDEGFIPADCNILICAGPRMPYSPDTVRQIADFIDNGGRLLVLAPPADPDIVLDEKGKMDDLLTKIGGSFRNDIVQDRERNDNRQSTLPLIRTRGGVEGFQDAVMPMARSIRDNPLAFESGWDAERLLESYASALSFDLERGGRSGKPGPFTMGYLATRKALGAEARVVVLSSTLMAADSDIGRGGNEALLTGLTRWLSGVEDALDISPRDWIDRKITLSGPSSRAMLWFGVVGMPLIWLGAGFLVWWLRKE